MPTVNSIAAQRNLTADVSAKIFRTDFDSASKSVLINGPMNSANEMVNSTFGLRSNISEMLGTYEEERESFNSEFDKTLSSLKESADKFQESVQSDAQTKAAVRAKAQENEQARRESAQKFADAARDQLEDNRQARREQADQIADITRERMQNSAQAQRERDQQIAEAATRQQTRTAEQIQRENSAQVVDTAIRQNQTDNRLQHERTEQISVAAHERAVDNEQTAIERTEQIVNDSRERAQQNARTRRQETERFAAQYLVTEEDAERTQNNAVEQINLTREENADAALSNVRNLVDRFNDAVSYFNENRGMSGRMSALAGNFGNAGNFTESLNSVGITVTENGRLRVNEERFANALNENSGNVGAVLGQNGLVGQLNRNLELANSQRENLFPSVTDYLNDRRDEPTESLYAVQKNQTAALSGGTAWNFVNMFT